MADRVGCPPSRVKWRKGMSRSEAPYLALTAEVIAEHLRGDRHIGLYPLGDDDTCWWVAPSVALGTDKSRRATPMQMLRDS
jgi:hypothetical protein